MKIAICYTTWGNRGIIGDSINHLIKSLINVSPEYDLEIFTVELKGIPRAKNKCLELAYESGADHIFLFDDDCYPITEDWWKPYVESKEPHLMFQFRLPNKPKSDMQELYRDDDIVAYSHTRGAMIYIERRVLDVVGGFDPQYGLGYYEHPDFTNRVYNAGLTTHRAMDVVDSDKLLYCLDKNKLVETSISPEAKKRKMENFRLYRKSLNSKEYIEFRDDKTKG